MWEGVGDWTKTALYWPQRCFFLVLQCCSTEGPRAHSAEYELTQPQLVSNSSFPPTHWLPVFTELYNSSIALSISILMASQAGICHFRRLWTDMFDHHQAEITVMQFRGHSLLVHQSMCVSWDLTLSISSAKPAYTISSHNCHGNVSLPSGASLWNGMCGRVEGQYITWWVSSIVGALRNVEHPFIAIAPASTLARSGSTW